MGNSSQERTVNLFSSRLNLTLAFQHEQNRMLGEGSFVSTYKYCLVNSVAAFRLGPKEHNQHTEAQNQQHDQNNDGYRNPKRLLIAGC